MSGFRKKYRSRILAKAASIVLSEEILKKVGDVESLLIENIEVGMTEVIDELEYLVRRKAESAGSIEEALSLQEELDLNLTKNLREGYEERVDAILERVRKEFYSYGRGLINQADTSIKQIDDVVESLEDIRDNF